MSFGSILCVRLQHVQQITLDWQSQLAVSKAYTDYVLSDKFVNNIPKTCFNKITLFTIFGFTVHYTNRVDLVII